MMKNSVKVTTMAFVVWVALSTIGSVLFDTMYYGYVDGNVVAYSLQYSIWIGLAVGILTYVIMAVRRQIKSDINEFKEWRKKRIQRNIKKELAEA